jgi:hypothetical protein
MPTDPGDSAEPWQDTTNAGLDAVERQIREAIARGEFDALPGAGKPLPDLDRQYEPAWWAKRFVERSRREDAANELRRLVREETPRLRAAPDREAAETRAGEINAAIAEINDGLDPADRIPLVELG